MAVLYAHAHAATVWLRAVAPCAQVTNAVTFALGAATDLPGLYSFCIYASVGAPSLCTLPLHPPSAQPLPFLGCRWVRSPTCSASLLFSLRAWCAAPPSNNPLSNL